MKTIGTAEGIRLLLSFKEESHPRQISHANQVVGGENEFKRPSYSLPAPEPRLPHGSHRFNPAEDFLGTLSKGLADSVACMPRGAPINGGAPPIGILSHVRRGLQGPKGTGEVLRVVSLVCANGDGMTPRNAVNHIFASLSLRRPFRQRQPPVDGKPVLILHQHVAHVAQLRLFALSLSEEPSIRVRRRGMRVVAPLLPLEVNRGIAANTRSWALRIILLVLFYGSPGTNTQVYDVDAGRFILLKEPSDRVEVFGGVAIVLGQRHKVNVYTTATGSWTEFPGQADQAKIVNGVVFITDLSRDTWVFNSTDKTFKKIKD